MKAKEKLILIVAIVTMVIVLSSYAIRFAGQSISPASADWGTLGDYFGGMLGPILTFLLIILVIEEASASRRQFYESKEIQLASQAQLTEQITLLRPRPELVYYLTAVNGSVFGILENIGNATAYSIALTFDFPEPPNEKILAAIRDFSNFHYFPPRYRAESALIGHINIQGDILGLTPHKVDITYSDSLTIDPSKFNKHYEIDQNMMRTVENERNSARSLQDIAQRLYELKDCFRHFR